jgi:hypothetical protein
MMNFEMQEEMMAAKTATTIRLMTHLAHLRFKTRKLGSPKVISAICLHLPSVNLKPSINSDEDNKKLDLNPYFDYI